LLSASSLLAACGGHAHQSQPHLQRSDAAQLIPLAQAVARDARGDGCTARSEIDALSAKARELVANGSVPLRLRAPLLAGVDALTAEAPACTPPPPPTPPGKEKKPHKEHHNHGHDGGD
jgi:hypothetical protein